MAKIVLGNLNDTNPPAPSDGLNIKWQQSGQDISANVNVTALAEKLAADTAVQSATIGGVAVTKSGTQLQLPALADAAQGALADSALQPVDLSNYDAGLSQTMCSFLDGLPKYDSDTHTMTFTRHDGATLAIDLPLEGLALDLDYDAATKELVLTLLDESEIRVSVADLVDEYIGSVGENIQVTIGAGNSIKAALLDGTILKAKLAAAVQSSLDKADGAVQSATIGGVAVTKSGTQLQLEAYPTLSSLDAASATDVTTHTGAANPHSGSEPTIAAGTTAQYYRGDKTWQTLNPAAVGAQAALNRTVGGNDNATDTVTDTGGNLSVPIPVTTTAGASNTAQLPAGTNSLRAVVQRVLDNLANLFLRIGTAETDLTTTVRHTAQTLTSQQQQQARTNIGAATNAQGNASDTAVQSAQIGTTAVTKTGTRLDLPAYPTLSDLNAASATDLTAHTSRTDNPHSVTQAQVGLTRTAISSATLPNSWPNTGIYHTECYQGGFPTAYGNCLTIKRTNDSSITQICQSWPGTDGGDSNMWIRGKRNVGTDVWGPWRQVAMLETLDAHSSAVNPHVGAQAALNGTGFVKASGTTVSYDNNAYMNRKNADITITQLNDGSFLPVGVSEIFNVNNLTLNLDGTNYPACYGHVLIMNRSNYVDNKRLEQVLFLSSRNTNNDIDAWIYYRAANNVADLSTIPWVQIITSAAYPTYALKINGV